MGVDLFAKQTLASSYLSYGTESYGGTLKWGLPLREELALQLRYSAFEQKITLPSTLNSCNNISPDFASTFPTPAARASAGASIIWDSQIGRASCRERV
jgi:outer membrane protein insertion porin family